MFNLKRGERGRPLPLLILNIMIKRYKCGNEISFNVNAGGKRRHIVFDTFSRGGSEYISYDETEQKAIESMPFFGAMIRLVGEDDEVVNEAVPEPVVPDMIPEIINCADAKLWLREKGVVCDLRSKAQIKAAAAELGVKFDI